MPIRLVCFDLDGTLIRNTTFIWQTLHAKLGTDNEERRAAAQKYFSGRCSYAEWARHDVLLWKRAGATRKKMLSALAHLRLVKNTRKTLSELKRRGIIIALVSGSLDIALESVLPDHGEWIDHCFINRIVFDKKGMILRTIPTNYDFAKKADALRLLMKKYHLKRSETMFVGDHDNDVEIAKLAGTAIAFNSKARALDDVADVILDGSDLKQILLYLL